MTKNKALPISYWDAEELAKATWEKSNLARCFLDVMEKLNGLEFGDDNSITVHRPFGNLAPGTYRLAPAAPDVSRVAVPGGMIEQSVTLYKPLSLPIEGISLMYETEPATGIVATAVAKNEAGKKLMSQLLKLAPVEEWWVDTSAKPHLLMIGV